MSISDFCVPAIARRRAVRGVSPLSTTLPGAGGAFARGSGHVHVAAAGLRGFGWQAAGAAGLRGFGWQAAGAAGSVRLQVPFVPAVLAAAAKPGTADIRKQYVPMTRVSAAGGDGALGPHRAWRTA